ncbi:hypothetical protein [Pontibacter ruber]|uniref:Uncharacterized protein n=1 Tax=Pontibacter ruber TaxID=1343895 RepID=A0ABW5D1B5_9BACT|nr:hypothetical protein [Pontibacter ruber]
MKKLSASTLLFFLAILMIITGLLLRLNHQISTVTFNWLIGLSFLVQLIARWLKSRSKNHDA